MAATTSVIRAFIAIDLAPEVRQGLNGVMQQLKEKLGDVPVRWVPAGNIHLTLKFLGDVSVSNLDMLKKILQTEASAVHVFEISVGGIGAFPSPNKARVIWAGVEAPNGLSTLQHNIESAMARIGYPREDRPFSPHLTLGRVSRNATSKEMHAIGDAISSTRVGFLGMVRVKEVRLYRSDLHPDGAVYTCIFSAPLTQAAAAAS